MVITVMANKYRSANSYNLVIHSWHPVEMNGINALNQLFQQVVTARSET